MIKTKLAVVRDFLIDVVFPINCLGCGREGEWLCPECSDRLLVQTCQPCHNCGGGNGNGETCRLCRKIFYPDAVLSPLDYNDELAAKLIKTLKYRFAKDLAPALAEILFSFYAQAAASGNILVFAKSKNILIIPVPLHKKRQNWRGFNQSEEIAKAFADKTGLELTIGKLVRIKHKKPQAKLSGRERIKNIQGCFGWQGESLAGRNVILIDDVITTGSTLNECAKILKQNGANKICALTAARG